MIKDKYWIRKNCNNENIIELICFGNLLGWFVSMWCLWSIKEKYLGWGSNIIINWYW